MKKKIKKSKKRLPMAEILGDDIMTHILLRLPVKYIVRSRCVRKSWSKLFDDPTFIQKHHDFAKRNQDFHLMFSARQLYSLNHNAISLSSYVDAHEINYPMKRDHLSVDIIGSCQGLICIKGLPNFLCIWNPATKEYKVILSPPQISLSKAEVYGFGYDDGEKDYKLVRIVNTTTTCTRLYEVQVYTLRSNTWKNIQPIPYSFFDNIGVFVNGALHWISENSGVIVSFDLREERFYELPLPYNCFDDDTTGETSLGVLGGHLSVCCSSYEINNVAIWVLKDYTVSESWSKLLTVSQPRCFESIDFTRPLYIHKNGDIVFEADFGEGKSKCNSLVTYNQKEESITSIAKVGGILGCLDTIVYVESLVSLNSRTYVKEEQGEEVIEPVRKKSKKA